MVVCAIALAAARGGGWKSMEKRLPVALRAVARFKSAKSGTRGRCTCKMAKSAKKGRRDAEDAELLHVMARRAKMGCRELMVASALAFGETRSTRSVIFLRTETRSDF